VKKSPNQPRKRRRGKPFEVVKIGNVSVPIYRQTNIVPQRDSTGRIKYGQPDNAGKRRALVKYQSDIFTVSHYEGSKRIRATPGAGDGDRLGGPCQQ
jgi:hypothetical protein